MKVSRRYTDGAGLVVLVAVALVVRFHGITTSGVWYDEAYSLLLAEGSPSEIWSTTARDVHPPLYYVILHYWMLLFGNSVLVARSLSALVDIGTLLLCVKLMSLVATRRAAWIAALLLALLPISVRYSQEIRMYTLLGCWLVGATVALVCWGKSPQRMRYVIQYVLLMTAAFYTHHFAALCVLVHWFFWWKSRGTFVEISIVAWVTANTAIVVLYLPWIPHFIEQLAHRDELRWLAPITWQTVLTIVWQFTVMTDVVPVSSWWRTIPTVIVLVCAVSILRRERTERHYNELLVSYFVIPAVVLFLVVLLTLAFISRYLLFAAVGLPLIVAAAVDAWWRQQRVLAGVVMVIFIAGEILGLLKYYNEGNGMEIRMNTISARINRDFYPDDEILIDSLYWYLPFTYYNATGIQPKIYVRSIKDALWGYPDQGGWALIPRGMNGVVFGDIGMLRYNSRRIWLITGNVHAGAKNGFPAQWKQTLVLDGGKVEARLFTSDATPASPEAGVQNGFTLQPIH